MPKRTMVGGAENIEWTVEVDCDLEDGALNDFLIRATYASPLNGLMRGRIDSFFKLGKNGHELPTAYALEFDAPLYPDPGNRFAMAEAGPSDLTLMEPIGLTPKKEVALGTSAGGSS
ncbi:MAG: OsmC family peroxiredoxin, partial [Pseudomonadota bacterium]